MSSIHILDNQTINQIAAGEVIENPSSVVKELVENAIDAKANLITVEIIGGGKQLIRVSDNGIGMTKEDITLCIKRHATSKITHINHLQSIKTMGFRGEAIPSIASISKMSIHSCPLKGDRQATFIALENEQITHLSHPPRDQGTTIEVKDLFYNVPARKKFQRSPTADTNSILKTITHLALAYPNIGFTLISNKKTLLQTKKNNNDHYLKAFQMRLEEVLGSSYTKNAKPVDIVHEYGSIYGFLADPIVSRQNKTGQFLFINKRFVTSSLISDAICQGYGTALASNKHPVWALHLLLDGKEVDINVHPQKKQVRFKNPSFIQDLLISTVNKTFHTHKSVSISFQPKTQNPFTVYKETTPTQAFAKEETFSQETISTEEKKITIPNVIATIKGFILVQGNNPSSITFIDQKAAKKRILYENLLKKEENKTFSQTLIVPIVTELTKPEIKQLEEHLPYFKPLGFSLEIFGDTTIKIDAIPTYFNEKQATKAIEDILNELEKFKKTHVDKQTKLKHIAKIAAKNASSLEQISLNEAFSLVKTLYACDNYQYCPYGYPIEKTLSSEEIEKLFK